MKALDFVIASMYAIRAASPSGVELLIHRESGGVGGFGKDCSRTMLRLYLLLIGALGLRLGVDGTDDLEVLYELGVLGKPTPVIGQVVEICHAAEVVVSKGAKWARKTGVSQPIVYSLFFEIVVVRLPVPTASAIESLSLPP